MATDYDLRLVVDADTSAARQKLDELGDSRPGGKEPLAPSAESQAAAERVRQGMPAAGKGAGGKGAGEEFGRAAGDVAGRMIGKAVAGFVAHQVASVVFAAMKTPGGDNRAVGMAEAGVGGALQYGTMGAMVAGPIAGLAGEAVRQKKALEARDAGIRMSDYARERDTPIAASDNAFRQSLEYAGGWRQRADAIRARRDAIANGEGSWSIKSLTETLKGLDPESNRGKTVAANLETQKQRVAQLDQQLIQEGLPWQPGRLEPGSVTDSFAKRGIQVGATVDVAQVNDRIMSEVQDCRRLLERIANMGTDNLHTVGAMQRTVFE
jgi:hypothetical protein